MHCSLFMGKYKNIFVVLRDSDTNFKGKALMQEKTEVRFPRSPRSCSPWNPPGLPHRIDFPFTVHPPLSHSLMQ